MPPVTLLRTGFTGDNRPVKHCLVLVVLALRFFFFPKEVYSRCGARLPNMSNDGASSRPGGSYSSHGEGSVTEAVPST